MIKIYVAGAISSTQFEESLKNVHKAVWIGAELLKLGFCPIVPHLAYQFCLVQDEQISVENFYKYGIELLKMCDCMVVIERDANSLGLTTEIAYAKEHKLPILNGLEEIELFARMDGIGQNVYLWNKRKEMRN